MATFLGRFQQLAKPAVEWASADPVLMTGELGISDPGSMSPVIKCGDNARPWSALPALTGGGGGGVLDNPTGTIGLTAVNGVATTGMRSDAAPALSQAIAPTWTGEHRFSGTLAGTTPLDLDGISLARSAINDPAIWFRNAGAPSNQKNWSIVTSPTAMVFVLYDDAGANARSFAQFVRSGGAVTNLSFGNTTDHPTFNFLGTTMFGASAPATILGQTAAVQTFGAGAAANHVQVRGSSDDIGAQYVFAKTRSTTFDGLTPVQAGDTIAAIHFLGADGTDFHYSAAIVASVAGAVASDQVPGQLAFYTASATVPGTGERLRISTDGALGIGGANYGTAGQVLTSGGPTAQPAWAAVPPGFSTANLANPTATIGLTAVNGSAVTAMRSDAAPPLSQAIVPTWTGAHTFNGTVDLAGPLEAAGAEGLNGQVLASQGAGLPAVWRSPGGGSIDLIFAFNTATAAADPGAQKCAFNASTYAAVTAIHYDITSQTNFDASTILSLLTSGNRIYMQQRNDATRAAIYQVTGAATNMGGTGWFSVPVTLISSMGVMFASNADITSVFMLSVSAGSGANPTASVGLTAVNGSALTFMRSDAAPPLSQAIIPTWTGQHIFTALITQLSNAGGPVLKLTDTDAGTDATNWRVRNNGGTFIVSTENDAGTEVGQAFSFTRAAAVISAMAFGNVTHNPAFNFLGTGLMAIGGQLSIGYASGYGDRLRFQNTAAASGANYHHYMNLASGTQLTLYAWDGTSTNVGTIKFSYATVTIDGGMVLGGATGGNKGAGTINATGLYVNNVAVGAGASGANPTASVGLTAVNGVAATFMRSDAAPAIDQAIVPTWTGRHTFTDTALILSNAGPSLRFLESDGATDEKMWVHLVNAKVYTFRTAADNAGAQSNILVVTRGTLGAVTNISFGNATDSATYTFLGIGALTFNGAVVGVGATGGGQGVGTINAKAIYDDGVQLLPAPAAANPTGTIGLTAVNGGAATFLRSDGAPALSQAIVPTWTAQHIFTASGLGNASAVRIVSDQAAISFRDTNAGTDEKEWEIAGNGTAFQIALLADLGTSGRQFAFRAIRTAAAFTTIELGNATNNPAFSFLGTGAATFSGGVVLGAPTGGNKGVGTINATGIYLNNVALTAAPAAANPTGTVGLTAVNGSAVTFMRSDGAPALSQTIVPTWTGKHTFTGTHATTGGPIALSDATSTGFSMHVTGQPADGKVWLETAVGTTRTWTIYNDAGSAGKGYLEVTRAANVVTLMRFGNAVDNPAYTFLGTGTVSAASFTTTSARAVKRETGAPSRARGVLERLRPILYRLLAGDDREQLGLVAEEVHQVCPQLSDGTTVAYDRLAILLLAAWQDEHAMAAEHGHGIHRQRAR